MAVFVTTNCVDWLGQIVKSFDVTGAPETSAHVFTWYIDNVELTSLARITNVFPFGESAAGIIIIPSAPRSGPLVHQVLTEQMELQEQTEQMVQVELQV